MLSNAALAVIDALRHGRSASIQGLAADTGYSTSQLYRVVDDLLDVGLLTEPSGNIHAQRRVQLATHPVTEAYRTMLSRLGHVDWVDLLSPATIRVCWYLDEPRRVSTIADRLNITRQAVHHALSPFKHRGMLSSAGPDYALVSNLQPVLDFARAVITHEHRARVRRLAPSATVPWCNPERALVHVHHPEDTDALQTAPEWELTGLARFDAFGLTFLLAGEPAFWYGPGGDLSPAQIVCHNLIADMGTRRVSYSLLLIEHCQITEDTLLDTASWYGIEGIIRDMYRFLHGDESVSESDALLPSRSEYESLKSQYGVA